MPLWLILAAVGTIVITALLTWVLWRINAPGLEATKNSEKVRSEDRAGT
jgi:hypothetical protein